MQYERDVEQYLKDQVKKRGGRCIKLHSISEEGLPDRMVLLPGGKIFFCELKRRGGLLSPMQRLQHKRFRSLGQRVHIPFSKEEVDQILKEETDGI